MFSFGHCPNEGRGGRVIFCYHHHQNNHLNVVFDVQKKMYKLPEMGRGEGRGGLFKYSENSSVLKYTVFPSIYRTPPTSPSKLSPDVAHCKKCIFHTGITAIFGSPMGEMAIILPIGMFRIHS